MNISSLLHLTDFRLRSTKRWWELNELLIIFDCIPNLQRLSLFLSTEDLNLVYGNILLPLLSPTIQEFNYAVYYCPELEFDQNDAIVASWPPLHRITCYISDTIWFIHTLHWYSPCIEIISSIGNIFSSQRNHNTCYDERVKRLEVVCDHNFTLSKSLAVIAQCHRMRELTIWLKADGGTVKEVKNSLLSLPKLSQLIQFQLSPSIPVDLHHLSLILVAAPELIQMSLPFDCLIGLLQIEHISHLLRQRIKTLGILNVTDPSQVTINEEHIHLIVSDFHVLRELYVDLRHLKPSTTIESNEIKSSSIESMILRLLSQFKQHKLNVLSVSIQPIEKIKQDPKEWLQQNTILDQQLFDAEFDEVLNRLMIWM